MGTRILSLLAACALTLAAAPPIPGDTPAPAQPDAAPADAAAPGPVVRPPPREQMPTYASMFANDDYPYSALRRREQGVVGFRITVDTKGRISDCRITSSSGSATLDEATCRLSRKRMRFRPARDAAGNPTTDMIDLAVDWRLPWVK
jgi:protein TonB